jgi:hypothetical protein
MGMGGRCAGFLGGLEESEAWGGKGGMIGGLG